MIWDRRHKLKDRSQALVCHLILLLALFNLCLQRLCRELLGLAPARIAVMQSRRSSSLVEFVPMCGGGAFAGARFLGLDMIKKRLWRRDVQLALSRDFPWSLVWQTHARLAAILVLCRRSGHSKAAARVCVCAGHKASQSCRG